MTQDLYRYSSSVPFMRPSVFAERVLDMKLYPIQKRVMDSLTEPNTKTTFMCCNSGGKTSRVITGLILWHLTMWNAGKVKSTAGSYDQVSTQLRHSLSKYAGLFDGDMEFFKTPNITTSHNGFWKGFSTNDAGKAEGDHADGPECPLLFVIDEAKTVPDEIFQAVDRCLELDKPTRLLYASSPGLAEGMFFQSHTLLKKYFSVFKQTAEDTPHITGEAIQRVKDKWSGFPAYVESMLGHDFMPTIANAVIDMKSLDMCLANPIEWIPGTTTAFCDFAWGGDSDENVLAICQGNRVTIEKTFWCDNLHGICDQFIKEFIRLGLKSHMITGDEGSAGKMICDELDTRGWSINRQNNQSQANDPEHYESIAAEQWYEGSKLITSRKIIIPNDLELRGQLLGRKQISSRKGRLAIESKRDMKDRGVPSPDRADAVLGCITPMVKKETGGGSTKILPMGIGSYQACGC